VAADIRLAIRGVEERRQDFHRRRLARAVGPDEAEQVASRQIQLDSLDGELVTVFFVRL